MQKGLIATFMVALMLITVLSSSPSVNAITISKEKNEERGTSTNYTFMVLASVYGYWPDEWEGIPFVKITLRVEGEEKNRVEYTNPWTGTAFFKNMPWGNNITFVSAEHWRYKYHSWLWGPGGSYLPGLIVEMVPKYTRTMGYPFLERFPLLNLLLQRLKI